jgi:p-cumate 2,3-dioxygenase subunit alpha
MKANWKLLIENSIDGYHAMATHHRYFVQYLTDIGADTSAWLGPRRQWGIGLALGGGHSVIENPLRPTPIMTQAKDELDRIRARLVDRFGPERAHRIADFNRNLLRLLLDSGVMAARHMTKAATRAPRRALPRRRALCTNSKKPR